MTLGPITVLWIVAGIAAVAFAGWGLVTGTAAIWTYPALVGGVASLLAGFYQAWWERNVFDAPPEDRNDQRGVTAVSMK